MPHEHMKPKGDINLSRIYDMDAEGYRVLIDRLWPRGVSKHNAALDEWFKDIAPSTKLRRWYDHQPARFDEFACRYRAELDGRPGAQAAEHLLALADTLDVVLLTATRD